YFVGGVSHQGSVIGGKFAIPALDAKPNEYGFFELFDSKASTFDARTICHLLHDTTTAETFAGPLYFPVFPSDFNVTMAATVGATKPLAGTSTVVVQLVDSTGA